VLDEAKMSNQVAFAWTGGAPAGDAAGVQAALAALAGDDARDDLAPVFKRVARELRRQREAACAG